MRIDESFINELDRETLIEDRQLALTIERILRDSDEDERDSLLADLVERLRREDLLGRAVQVADQISIDWASVQATLLSRLASDFYRAGNESEAYRLLIRALRTSRDCDVAWQEAEVRIEISGVLVQMTAHDVARKVLLEAIDIAKRDELGVGIQDSIDASSVLAAVAEALAGMGSVEKAREVALGIRNSLKRNRALKQLDLLAEDR